MEILAVFLLFYLFFAVVVFPIWALTRLNDLRDTTRSLRSQLSELRTEVFGLREALNRRPAEPVAPPPAPALPPVEASAPVAPPTLPITPAPAEADLPVAALAASSAAPADLAQVAAESPVIAPQALEAEPPSLAPPVLAAAASAQPEPAPRPVYTPPPPQPRWLDTINWEQFMGAKLFAWLGGLALFLGLVFFVKYSFEHDLIPAAVRVAIGFVVGAGLVVGGLKISRERYAITSQTLIAAGIVSLYAVTFACRSIYHFEFFGPIPTFLLMSLITGTAFVLAVRLNAPVVAILGILGGFLTPKLLSTGVDNPAGLFGYLALLNVGLIAVSLHRRWFYLVPLGAAGTVLTMIAWAGLFFAPEKTVIAMTVCAGFSALFIGTAEAARRIGRSSPLVTRSAIALSAVALGFAWYFLNYPLIAARTGLFFGYVSLVSLGLFFLAWRERLGVLVAGAAAATVLLLTRWAGQGPGVATSVIMTVCLAFCALYFAAYLLARRREEAPRSVLGAAVALPLVALGFAFFLMGRSSVSLLFGFILAADVLLLAIAWLDERMPRLHLVAGLAVFGLLSLWTANTLTDALLPWALAMYLVFAALHTVFPLLLERKHPAAAPTWWSQLFPPLTLLLMLLPIFKLESVSFLIWPAILLVDLIAIALAALSASLAAVAAVLVLTLVATAGCLFRLPVTGSIESSLLLVLGAFALLFFGASLWLARRIGNKLPAVSARAAAIFGDPRAQLPAFASLLPFLLLIMACARLTIPNPSAVFGLGLLLVVLTLGLARQLVIAWLPACALAGVAALELTWHSRHFSPAAAEIPLAWYVGFTALFAVFPFLFRRTFAGLTGPWCVAALSGVAHFWMTYDEIRAGWPGMRDVLGLVPALFALAPLASLVAVLRQIPADEPKRLDQLAWFGGVGLFFITLIFPIQFERQWLTVAWALEGAALLWLFHRVPHPGLRATGVALLLTAFVRLALNPAVLGYHVRGDVGLFNWYLYAYGVATAALFTGAWLLAPPRERVFGLNVPPLLNSLGTILAFVLLNIEIADFFTPPGARALALQFNANLPRDMSYTIGWALFAFGLLVAGIWRQTKAARYAAIALLSVALLKLFFHDLARLEALYRVGALFAVAVIAILASFAYQRFLPGHDKATLPPAA